MLSVYSFAILAALIFSSNGEDGYLRKLYLCSYNFKTYSINKKNINHVEFTVIEKILSSNCRR